MRLAGIQRRLAAGVMTLAGAHLVPLRLRSVILKWCGAKIAPGARVFPGAIFRSAEFSLGERSTLNYRCIVDNWVHVSIGDRVGVGMGVQFVTSSHVPSDPTLRAGRMTYGPILVGDGAWIGSGAIILQGVTIGAGAVVAAGSVVVRDVPEHTLYGGVPAKLLRDL